MRYSLLFFLLIYSFRVSAEVGCPTFSETIHITDPRDVIGTNFLQINPAVMNGLPSKVKLGMGSFHSTIQSGNSEDKEYSGLYQGFSVTPTVLLEEVKRSAQLYGINDDGAIASLWGEKINHTYLDNETVSVGAKDGSEFYESRGNAVAITLAKGALHLGYGEKIQTKTIEKKAYETKIFSSGAAISFGNISLGRAFSNERYGYKDEKITTERSTIASGVCLYLYDENQAKDWWYFQVEAYSHDKPNYLYKGESFGQEKRSGIVGSLNIYYDLIHWHLGYEKVEINKDGYNKRFQKGSIGGYMFNIFGYDVSIQTGESSEGAKFKSSSMTYMLYVDSIF